jgi:hypothetical protein
MLNIVMQLEIEYRFIARLHYNWKRFRYTGITLLFGLHAHRTLSKRKLS